MQQGCGGASGSLQDNQGNGNHKGRAQEDMVEKGSEAVCVSICDSPVHMPLGEILTGGSYFLSGLSGEVSDEGGGCRRG